MTRINNADVPAAIRAREPFENKSRTLRGFHDVTGRYGVVSYDQTIALEKDGELRVATGYPRVYGPHVELVEQGR